MFRYAARSTCAFSRTLGRRFRPLGGFSVVRWAAARLSACCSRRSMPKSSARIGSSAGEELSMTAAVAFISSFHPGTLRGCFRSPTRGEVRNQAISRALAGMRPIVVKGRPENPNSLHEPWGGVILVPRARRNGPHSRHQKVSRSASIGFDSRRLHHTFPVPGPALRRDPDAIRPLGSSDPVPAGSRRRRQVRERPLTVRSEASKITSNCPDDLGNP